MISFDENKFSKDSLSLWYSGKFGDHLTDRLIEMAAADLTEEGLGKSHKRISFLMAESFQNVVRHGVKDEQNSSDIFGTFGVVNRAGQFHIYSSNRVESGVIDAIGDKLNQVNNLNAEELKALYKEMLVSTTISEKGGAGLGLIEMARKSGNPLQYIFRSGEEFDEFCLQIDRGLDGEDSVENSNLSIQESADLDQYFHDNGVLLYFRGDFDTDTTQHIISMLNENVDDDASPRSKAIFHVGVELVQNISRHSWSATDKREGSFILAQQQNEIILSSINRINPDRKVDFEEHLKKLRSRSLDELKDWYKTQLRASVNDESNNAGVGLIDVARITNGKISYAFETQQDQSVVKIEVRISIN